MIFTNTDKDTQNIEWILLKRSTAKKIVLSTQMAVGHEETKILSELLIGLSLICEARVPTSVQWIVATPLEFGFVVYWTWV